MVIKIIKLINLPYEDIIKAALLIKPNAEAEVIFDPSMSEDEDGCGFTLFPDDGSIPDIYINANIPFFATIEILAHELAHVIVGAEHEHDKVWEGCFEEIRQKYEQIVEEKYK